MGVPDQCLNGPLEELLESCVFSEKRFVELGSLFQQPNGSLDFSYDFKQQHKLNYEQFKEHLQNKYIFQFSLDKLTKKKQLNVNLLCLCVIRYYFIHLISNIFLKFLY